MKTRSVSSAPPIAERGTQKKLTNYKTLVSCHAVVQIYKNIHRIFAYCRIYIDNVNMSIYHIIMLITWNETKNEANYRKHGVWFEEAQTVIISPHTLMAPNDHPDGDRFEYLGHSVNDRILYVVTVEKTDLEIRIISARKATTNERKKYEEGI